MKRIDAVYIDLQRDFIEGGSLGVPGGKQAAQNSANLLNRLGKKISNLYASLDSHQSLQIFHPLYFLDQNNQHPQPFTQITHQDLLDGVWRTSKRALQKKAEEYTKELERKGKYKLQIWPNHCRLNTPGWLLEENVANAFTEWEENNYRRINYIAKGNNPYTEFYSALEAEVPQNDDPNTQLNIQIINSLEEADEIIFCGLCLSHCLRYTMESIFNNFSNSAYLKKCVLLTDCTASVPGFEQQGEDFVKDAVSKGMQVSTSKDFLA